jgi:DNA-binding beta-propeller fold protein YncE
MRITLALLCVIGLMPIGTVNASKEKYRGPDTVWVVNRDKGTFMVYDAASGDPVTPVPVEVGPGLHDIVASPRTGTVFITDDSSKVYVVSMTTYLVVETIQFNAASRPHHLSISHDGKTVYAGLFASNTVAAIDTRTYEARQFVSSTQPGFTAHAPEPSPNDRFIYVPHEGQNLVSRLSVRRATIDEVTLGTAANSSPTEVLPTRNSETLYVAMRGEGTIRTIDLETFTATTDVVAVGTQPESLILTPDERTLIVGLRGTPARVAFVDTETMQLDTRLDVAGTGTFGDLAVGSPDGSYVYAAFDATAAGTGGVAKIDVRRRKVVDTFAYPTTGRPHGIAYVAGKSNGRKE